MAAALAAVTLLPATATANLVVAGNHQILQSHAGGFDAAGDAFGKVLAAGDFNRDGHDDLAIGAPDAEAGGVVGAGIVQVVDGWRPGWIFGDDFEAGHRAKWSDTVD